MKQFPVYYGSDYHFHKQISEKEFLTVFRGVNNCRIEFQDYIDKSAFKPLDIISEDEFLAVYSEVNSTLFNRATKREIENDAITRMIDVIPDSEL